GELGPGPRDGGIRGRHRLSQRIHLLASEGQRRARLLEGDLVGSRIDQKEELSLLDLLVVMDRELDDVPRDFRGDPDEVGAHGGVIGLREVLPPPDGDDDGDQGTDDDERAEGSSKRTTLGRGYLVRFDRRLSHGIYPRG